MRAENFSAVIDQRLVGKYRLTDTSGRIPFRHQGRLNVDIRNSAAGNFLRESYRSNRRQCEGDARYAAIVGPILVAFENIGGHRFRVIPSSPPSLRSPPPPH